VSFVFDFDMNKKIHEDRSGVKCGIVPLEEGKPTSRPTANKKRP
jgi:hypothetical protein